jgi:hypothetical protein
MIPAFYDTNGALRIGSSRLVPPLIINPAAGGQQAGGNGFPNLNSSLNLGSPLSSAMRHARDPFLHIKVQITVNISNCHYEYLYVFRTNISRSTWLF